MRLNNQLCNDVVLLAAYLRKVADNLLLALIVRLVLIRPFRHLFGLYKVLVESAEIHARRPHGARPLQRCLEHATLLDVLPFVQRQIERLRLGQRR